MATLITLDTVRGGLDGGLRTGTGASEKELAFGVMARTADLIRKSGLARARLLRQGDYYLPPVRRGELAAALQSGCHAELCLAPDSAVRVRYSTACPQDDAPARSLAEGVARALSLPCGGCAADTSADALAAEGVAPTAEGVAHLLTVVCPIAALTGKEAENAAACERLAVALADGLLKFLKLGELPASKPETRVPKTPPKPEAIAPKTPVLCPINGQGSEPASQKALFSTEEKTSAAEKEISAAKEEPPAPKSEAARGNEGVISPGIFFMREQPDFSARVLTVVHGGQRAVCIEQTRGFCRVSISGKSGYIVSEAWKES